MTAHLEKKKYIYNNVHILKIILIIYGEIIKNVTGDLS